MHQVIPLTQASEYHFISRDQTNPCGVADQQIRSLFIRRLEMKAHDDGASGACVRAPLPSANWSRRTICPFVGPAPGRAAVYGPLEDRSRAVWPAIVSNRSTVSGVDRSNTAGAAYQRTDRPPVPANHNNRLKNGLEIIFDVRERSLMRRQWRSTRYAFADGKRTSYSVHCRRVYSVVEASLRN